MSTHSPRRTLVVAVLLAVLAVPVLAAQPLPRAEVPNLDSLLARLWSLVDDLFEKEGSSIDPFGINSAPPPPSTGGQGEAGMTIDPDGANVAGGAGVIANPNN